MTANPVCVKLAPDSVAHTLQHEAMEKLSVAGGELVLEFSSVARIDASAARAMEELADAADRTSVRVVLRGVDTGIYRALKLLQLSQRFSFSMPPA